MCVHFVYISCAYPEEVVTILVLDTLYRLYVFVKKWESGPVSACLMR